ncbi:LOW QUALITY PROTEIN: hypothetical protein TorRG33x02_182350 [Trema orientale]|uniref:Uncharacterized protein n=1 Tax=Trema orientale TaxID=63057 RepID=A0A2P5EKH1_TREOI|nr:LOW QUALITY PROTEIN: hypothetical protein TorRG33x02_182350 [Trema orientale]
MPFLRRVVRQVSAKKTRKCSNVKFFGNKRKDVLRCRKKLILRRMKRIEKKKDSSQGLMQRELGVPAFISGGRVREGGVAPVGEEKLQKRTRIWVICLLRNHKMKQDKDDEQEYRRISIS